MHIFPIKHDGTGRLGTQYFKVKKRYDVSVRNDGFTTCTCQAGTMDVGRKKSAQCKHGIAVRRLLKAIGGKKIG